MWSNHKFCFCLTVPVQHWTPFICGAGTKRKFAAPRTAPLAELPIKDVNIQPGRPQAGEPTHPSAQEQQGPPANTRQKKKPRVAFGRRVGVAVNTRPQGPDIAPDSLEVKQAAGLSENAPNLPSSSVMTGRHTSASRLEAIVQASQALALRSAQTEGVKPSGDSAQTALAQAATNRVHAPAAAKLAAHAEDPSPTPTRLQAGQVEPVQVQPELAVAERSVWQAPYNHAAYVDDSFHSPSGSSKAMHSGQPSAATASNGFDSLTALHVPQAHSKASDLPGAIRMSVADLELQQQYDTLLTDYTTQQQQSQVPVVRHSRFGEQHHPGASAKPTHDVVQTMPDLAASMDRAQAMPGSAASCRAQSMKAVQAEPSRADASTSPLAGRHTSTAYPASQVVVLPDDPFQQQLPQHLHELSQLPDQQLQHMGEQSQHPQQKPELPGELTSNSHQLTQHLREEGELPQQQLQLPGKTIQLPQHLLQQTQLPPPKSELLGEQSQLHLAPQPASSLSLASLCPANCQPELQQPIALSVTAPAQDLQAPALTLLSAQQQNQLQSHLRLQPELPPSDVASALPMLRGPATLQATSPASAIQDTVNNQEVWANYDRDVDARVAAQTKLLRASLAEWLADAVAGKLWSALEQQRLASNSAEAQEQQDPDTSKQTPGDSARLQSYSMLLLITAVMHTVFVERLFASNLCRNDCMTVHDTNMQSAMKRLSVLIAEASDTSGHVTNQTCHSMELSPNTAPVADTQVSCTNVCPLLLCHRYSAGPQRFGWLCSASCVRRGCQIAARCFSVIRYALQYVSGHGTTESDQSR